MRRNEKENGLLTIVKNPSPVPPEKCHTPGLRWYNCHQALLSIEHIDTSKTPMTNNGTRYITPESCTLG